MTNNSTTTLASISQSLTIEAVRWLTKPTRTGALKHEYGGVLGHIWTIYKAYMLVFCVGGMAWVFHVGSNLIVLATVVDPSTMKQSADAQAGSLKCPEKGQVTNTPVNIAKPAIDEGRVFRNVVLSLAYYGSLISALLSIDAALGLRDTTTRAALYVVVAFGLAPLHTLWTHNMILHHPVPYKDMRARLARLSTAEHYKALLLPSTMHAGTQMLVLINAINHFAAALDKDCRGYNLLVGFFSTVSLWHTLIPLTSTMLILTEAELLPSHNDFAVPFDRSSRVQTESNGSGPEMLYNAYLYPMACAGGRVTRRKMGIIMKLNFYRTIAFILALGARGDS